MPLISIQSVDCASAIPGEAWQRLAPAGDPFLNADFLSILERHGTAGRQWGWVARHLVARDEGQSIVGILPIYAKSNSFGDFTSDWSWASAYEQLGRPYYPKLLSGMPHTPATGPRILIGNGPEATAIRAGLIEAARASVGDYRLSSWHVAFPAADERGPLLEAGLLASHDVQFHWLNPGAEDFAGYLAGFAADKRRKVRAERRRVGESGLRLEVRHGDEIAPDEWPALHRLYAATFDKFSNHAVFSAECFADLAQALGRRMVVFSASDGCEPVAVSLCFRSDEALYGRYWGCHGSHHSLHFELCFYQGIEYCLTRGLRRFEPGAGGEHKISRGFSPTRVECFHWIEDARMRELIARHLLRQNAAVAAYQDDASAHLPFRQNAATLES